MPERYLGLLSRIAAQLVRLPRGRKRALLLLLDALFIPAALASAMALKQDGWPQVPSLLYVAALVTAIPIFIRLGLYRAVIRFIGPRAIAAAFVGVTSSAAVLMLINYASGEHAVPLTALLIYWAIALIYVSGTRIVVRFMINARPTGGERVVIYGAGAAGAQAASALRFEGRFEPVAFIDDDASVQGRVIAGAEVHPSRDLPRIVKQESVGVVLLALPSQTRRRRREILKSLESLPVRVLTVPDIGDLLAGIARIEDVREVDAADLLGRDVVPPNERLFDSCIRDKVVMVTGAGGSIGSELCRQIIHLRPRRLVLFEMSELALYQAERELRAILEREGIELELVSLLGNAHHKYRIREVLQSYGVQTLYHAAAYKHVPIVEQNVIEGIHNNVVSTWYTAEAAIECGVETFLLVSTDKAVNPTNVMGATKRVAEMVLQALQQRGSRTRFCMVRFGNVLESSGSVVPLFREQIRKGGPLTVTHPDVIRYFMTIPEAAQLVLQAGAMATGGDVFVLDMGKPIRIADLARRMIHLAGLTVRDDEHPEGDVEILYTGLRPAEKLYEELLIGTNVSGTEHPMIMRAMEHSLSWEDMHALLQRLLVAMGQLDVAASCALLREAVPEYRPTGDIVDRVWMRTQALRQSSNVTSLADRRPPPRRDVAASGD